MLRQIFEPDDKTPYSASYRWGMLFFLILLIGWSVQIEVTADEFIWGYLFRGLIVPLMLLFNHLAFAFSWPRRVSIFLKVLAVSWLVFGSILIVGGWIALSR